MRLSITIALFLWIAMITVITFYAIMKEREELGCFRVSIATQCDDHNSVYVKGTKMEKNDTNDTLYKRMMSIMSYHEKGGVWKRCIILATILTLFAFLILSLTKTEEGRVGSWIMLYLMFFIVMYFYFNYLNYHHHRNLKNNGQEILDEFVSRHSR